jgi:hypothetical protein
MSLWSAGRDGPGRPRRSSAEGVLRRITLATLGAHVSCQGNRIYFVDGGMT